MASIRMRSLFFALLLPFAACGGDRPAATPAPGVAPAAPAASATEVSGLSELEEALLQACEKGDLSSVKALLDKGVNVNARDKDGRRPLIEASYWQHADIVKLLIERAADVNAKKVDGATALDFAINFHNKEIEEMLRKAGAKSDKDAAAAATRRESVSATSPSPAAKSKR
jgi:ankyrin repeat protein